MKTNIEMFGPRPEGEGWKRASFWDCFDLKLAAQPDTGAWLFGRTNIGNARLTNLHNASRLAFDSSEIFAAHCWYLKIPATERLSLDEVSKIRRVLEEGLVVFSMGDQPQSMRHLIDLYDDIHPLDWLTVPERQCSAAHVSLNPNHADVVNSLSENVRCWLHVEGWRRYVRDA